MKKKLSAWVRGFAAVVLMLFSTNFLPVTAAFADSGSTDIVWGQQGRDQSDPDCQPGQTANFHFVLSPSGTHITDAGTINVSFLPSGSDSDAGSINGNGAASYNVSGPYNAVADSATVTGASWTSHNDKLPQIELSDSYCTGTPTKYVTAGEVTYVDLCGKGSDTYTVPATDNVYYKDGNGNIVSAGTHAASGTITITAYAKSGYTLSSPYSFTHTFTDDSCGPVQITAPEVTFTDVCGTDGDGYTIPDADHVYYTLTGDSTVLSSGFHAASGSVSITAHADNGYALTGQTLFTKDFTDVHCDTKSVTLCHATGSQKNPYVEITIDAAGAYNGHYSQHGHDIIPPFYYGGNQYSLNWDTSGQTIWDAGCKLPKPIKVRAVAPTKVNITCDENGSYTIPDKTGVQYYVNGVATDAGTYQVSGATTIHVRAEAVSGYKLIGAHFWKLVFKAPADCVIQTAVTPNVQFSEPTCENTSGRITVTAVNGVTYKLNGQVISGTVTVAAGSSATVTAELASGYVLASGASDSFSHDFAAAPTDCVLGSTDVCPNITGDQATVPAGMTKDSTTGNCVTTPIGRGGDVLGASTTAQLANTGESPLVNIIVGLSALMLTLTLAFVSRKQYRLDS